MEFNAKKTQTCLLSQKRSPLPGNGLNVGGIDIAKSDTLEVLGTSIRSDLRWDDHIFGVAKEAAKCLGFLKRCKKYFTPTDLCRIYTTYIRPKMEYNSHLWAGASKTSLDCLDKVQNRAVKLIGDDSVSNTITSLGHRRDVGSLVLFYRYYFGNCSQELKRFLPPMKVFNRNTRLSAQSHPFTVSTMTCRTMHYRDSSFFSRVAQIWNRLSPGVFPEEFNITRYKFNINKFLQLSPP